MRNFSDFAALNEQDIAASIATCLEDTVDDLDGLEFGPVDDEGNSEHAALEVGDASDGSFLIETTSGQTFRVMVVEIVK